MSGGSEGTTTTTPVITTTPGATGELGYGTSNRLFGTAENMTNAGPNLSPIRDFNSYGSVQNVGDYGSYGDTYNGVFSRSLEDAILNPRFGAQNPNEQNLINSLMDVTSGRGAVSGLGAPTQSALASSIAPTLVDLRERNIQDLIAGRTGDINMRGQDIQRNLGLRGQDIGMRGQDTERNLGLRGQDISINAQQIQQWMGALQSLAELAGLSMPQTVMTSNTQGSTEDVGLLSGENLWGGSW